MIRTTFVNNIHPITQLPVEYKELVFKPGKAEAANNVEVSALAIVDLLYDNPLTLRQIANHFGMSTEGLRKYTVTLVRQGFIYHTTDGVGAAFTYHYGKPYDHKVKRKLDVPSILADVAANPGTTSNALAGRVGITLTQAAHKLSRLASMSRVKAVKKFGDKCHYFYPV